MLQLTTNPTGIPEHLSWRCDLCDAPPDKLIPRGAHLSRNRDGSVRLVCGQCHEDQPERAPKRATRYPKETADTHAPSGEE